MEDVGFEGWGFEIGSDWFHGVLVCVIQCFDAAAARIVASFVLSFGISHEWLVRQSDPLPLPWLP